MENKNAISAVDSAVMLFPISLPNMTFFIMVNINPGAMKLAKFRKAHMSSWSGSLASTITSWSSWPGPMLAREHLTTGWLASYLVI